MRYFGTMAQSAYLDSIADKQGVLDALVRRFAVSVVGNGYIDIIVTTDRCYDFIKALTETGFLVEALSWWCHATDENKKSLGCPHGYGGPMTEAGWFSEMSHVIDEVSEVECATLDAQCSEGELRRINEGIAELIRCKQIGPLTDGSYLKLTPEGCLTPGIWVRVPQSWSR